MNVLPSNFRENRRCPEGTKFSTRPGYRFAGHRHILNGAPDAILVTDNEGRILLCNLAAARMFGTRESEAAGARLDQFLSPPPDRPTIGWEAVGKHRSGRKFPVDVSVSTITTGRTRHTIHLLRDATPRVQAERRLQRANDQLRTLALRLQSVREEERSTLAREIHDELAQNLTRLKIDTAWCRHEVANLPAARRLHVIADRLEAMSREINGAIATVQRIATELRPALLDHFGLGAAIEWEAREFEKRTGIPCQTTLPATEPDIATDASIALFRIVQESLTNIIRHAAATGVEVTLGAAGPDIVLTIHDNGRGIPPEQLRGGMSIGLLGMRERAMALDGELEIGGAAGGGTTVRVRIPSKPPSPIPAVR